MKRLRFLFGASGEKGAIAPIVALGLLAFVGFMALGIDLGQLYMVRNELQNVADGAALAAAKQLIQDGGGGAATVNCPAATQAAIDCAKKNYTFGVDAPIKITAADVTVGLWDLSTKQFSSTGCSPAATGVNAVQVTVHRSGTENNPKVATFFGNVLGTGAEKEVEATAVAFLGLAGTSSPDVPFSIPYYYVAGGGVASNGWQRVLDKIGPTPAYAATKSYRWKDLGGYNPVRTDRATFVVPTQSEQSNAKLLDYIKGPAMGGKKFPQKKVGDQLWPMSEWYWGSYVKNTFNVLKSKFNDPNTPKINGKWRVTVPVFKTTPVTAALPQDSWFKLASRLLPGVSQAYACTAYSPAVYNQGFATIDITGVVVNSTCNQSTDQVTDSNSCRNTCYMDIEVPLDQNTMSTDKTSTPIPFQKDYKDMNPAASEVGVFSSVPRIVK
jgi:Flp pilus assembly protein TadG